MTKTKEDFEKELESLDKRINNLDEKIKEKIRIVTLIKLGREYCQSKIGFNEKAKKHGFNDIDELINYLCKLDNE